MDKQYKSISARYTIDEYREIYNYCQRNKIKLSDLVRQAIEHEMELSKDSRILQECEAMIDQKLKILNIPILKNVSAINTEVIN